jgi:hypothetical protein
MNDRFSGIEEPAGHEPELRALLEILAAASADGVQVIFLGPAGILEIARADDPGRRYVTAN